MKTPEGCVRLCAYCPNREFEGTSKYDPVTGDLVEREPHYMNARLEFVTSPDETPDIPTQEFGTAFIDTEGNRTSAFMPGVQLEDIAACDKPEVSGRYGFLWLKKRYDCGAQAVKLAAFREKMQNKKAGNR
jgi:hypothetical protein